MKKYPKKLDEWKSFEVEQNENELLIGGWQVMQTWELPLMKFLAQQVTWNHGDILEVGFGMGISATEIIKNGCASYTVIEAHPTIVERAKKWAKNQDAKIRILEGFWQDIIPSMKNKFDGILFDTFPMHSKEKYSNHFPFIPYSPKILKKNGILTFFSDEKIPFRNNHLTLLFNHFDEVKFTNVKNLNPPKNCEYWKDSYMIIPVCKKI